ncbi:MAG: tripartite tricarboxylate transporter TctB family protein [Burkholderiales bacterium]|nr:tripartite tricarboxylate transporter TctB family protein [Burkholderiales bacterium]
MPAKLRDSLPYWVTLAVSAYLYSVAMDIAAPGTGDQLGPDFWPKATLILMMATCVAGILKAMAGSRDHSPLPLIEGTPAADEHEPSQRYPWLLLVGVVLCLAYVLLFETLGFFLDTFLFMLAFILVGRYRRIGIAIATCLAGSLVFMFVFMKIVYVALPIGAPPFSHVSLLLMRLFGIR